MRVFSFRTFLSACAVSVIALGSPNSAHSQQPSAPKPTSGQKTDIGSQVRFKVEKFTLPNGLTVLLHEDHSVPLVSYHTWFRVGSKDEDQGLTGMAHLFEHMMFKGAKRYTGEQFDTMLQANGATNNAFTTSDYTGYYENLPSDKLELAIDIESDRMENLQINAESLKSEREVVKEERRFRVDNNPGGLIREAMNSTVFKVSPYRWPVIGYMPDLDNVTPENATAFYKMYYAPNNAVIVVAGDFDPKEARKLIERYYGKIKSQPINRKKYIEEPTQNAARQQFLEKDVQSTQFVIAYPTPKAGTDEAYALDLLANIMGSGTSSRLHQRLVYKDQIATSASAFNWTMQDSGIFQVYVTLKPEASFDRAQRAAFGEMWRPRNLRITDVELQKAKNQVMKSYVDGLKTIHGKAEALAINEIYYGDYEQLFKDLDRYNKVTADQVKKAAQKYLGPEKSSLIVLKRKK